MCYQKLCGETKKMDSAKTIQCLTDAAQELQRFLREHYDPMAVAIVSVDRVDILRAECGGATNKE